ncbi:MAG TPA: GAF domain-containing protein, partial [Bryobacteraceae bacterium]|nr:GAF domain-containing protein [Bryobacteraceae bacterium]
MGSATLDLLELHRAVRKLQAASRSNRLDALQDILREIATAAGAFGCAMWEIAPGADLQAWQGRLFLVGAWFEKKDVHPHYLLRIENSFTGAAIREEAPKFTVRLEDEPLSPDSAKHPLVSHGVESALSVPIELYHSKTKASVNLYWSETIHLEERQKQELSLLCSLVPDLYGALVDRVGLNLIKCADQILSRKEYSAKTSSKQRDRAVQLGLEEFVKAVSEVFDSVETSIFLESRGDQNQFALRATDWRWTKPVHKKVYGKGEGITGYVLATEEPVRILDLGRYNEEREAIRKQYDGLEWKDPLDIRRTARETLGLKEGDELPPLSHMSVPVMNEGRLLGAIRCSCRRKPPYFFDDRQVQVLELAAATLGSWWENWMERWETEREAEDWRDVMEKIASLNGYVHAQLNQHIPDERAIFRETMKFLANLIPETVANDVRLIDRQQKRLEIVETDGSLWDKGNYEDQRQRRQKVFPLDGNSAAAHVVATRKAYVVEDTTQAHRYDATFDEVRTVALAPLVCGKEVYGTLGVRRGVDRKFSQH